MALEIGTVTYKTFDGQEVTLGAEDVRRLCGKNGQYLLENEIDLFIKTAMYRRLNPYLGELYILKNAPYKNKQTGETKEPSPAQIIISRQAVMMIAEEHPAYDGLEHGIVVLDKEGEIVDREGCILLSGETLLGGWAKVYRKDRRVPYLCRIDLKEYSKQKQNGDGTWDKMTKTMIDKCAVVTAMRSAFPQQLGGLYTQEEVDNSNFTPTETEEPPKQIVDIPVIIPNKNVEDQKAETVEELPFPEEPKEPKQEDKFHTIDGTDYKVEPVNKDEKLWYVEKEYFLEHKDGLIIVDAFRDDTAKIPVQKVGE